MRCDEVRELLPEWLEGETDARVSAEVELHLASCPECREDAALWKQISSNLRSMSPEIPAPTGFTSGVMARIEAEHKRPLPLWALNWKRTVATAAAAAVLAGGSIGLSARWFANPVTPIAQNPPGVHTTVPGDINDPGTTNPDVTIAENPVDPQGGTTPTNPVNPTATSGDDPVTTPGPDITGEFVFTSAEQDIVIRSTLLQLNVDNLATAYQSAAETAKALDGSVEILSVQNSQNGRQQTIAVAIPADQAGEALTKLAAVGECVEQIPNDKDVSATYNEKATLYNNLVADWEASEDEIQKAQLEAEMTALKKQLDEYLKKAELQTVVLILESKG